MYVRGFCETTNDKTMSRIVVLAISCWDCNAVLELLQIYLQKTMNKREPKPQQNRNDKRRRGVKIFPHLTSLGSCRQISRCARCLLWSFWKQTSGRYNAILAQVKDVSSLVNRGLRFITLIAIFNQLHRDCSKILQV